MKASTEKTAPATHTFIAFSSSKPGPVVCFINKGMLVVQMGEDKQLL